LTGIGRSLHNRPTSASPTLTTNLQKQPRVRQDDTARHGTDTHDARTSLSANTRALPPSVEALNQASFALLRRPFLPPCRHPHAMIEHGLGLGLHCS
jgi:hypothetical protein